MKLPPRFLMANGETVVSGVRIPDPGTVCRPEAGRRCSGLGDVAHLVERGTGCAQVAGSSPVVSTALYCKVASQVHTLRVLCESGMRHHLGSVVQR